MEEKIFIKKLFDNNTAKIILTLIGLMGTFITIYVFFQEQKVDLRYEIIANTNVLDFNADLSKLEVTYDSTNLKQTNENLRIFTIKIVNNGNKNITKDFYDENDPIGIQIDTGKIIEKPEVIFASNDYLSRNLKLTEYKKEKITFSQVILESGEFIIIKLLVLHKKESIPQIMSIGKIAGQKEIKIVNSIDVQEEQSFLGIAFQGNIWIQLLRFITYFLIGVGNVVLIIYSLDKIDTFRRKKKRYNLVQKFKENYTCTRIDDVIFERYERDDYFTLINMMELLEDEDRLNRIYKKQFQRLRRKESERNRKNDFNKPIRHYTDDYWFDIHEMINDGIVFKEGDKLVFNQSMRETLIKFLEYLKENGEPDRYSKNILIQSNEDYLQDK